MIRHHLAILKKPYLDAILAGGKTIESRFTKTRLAPFGQVAAGDKIFLKQSCRPVCAMGTAATVKNFENLTPEKMTNLKQQYNHQVAGSDEYWQSRTDCQFGVLIWLKDVKPIESVQIDKKDWRAWVVLTAKENFGLLAKQT